ncbi:MAG: hypothetical protein AAGC73_01270 [Verrucomicrobiota bacterium]
MKSVKQFYCLCGFILACLGLDAAEPFRELTNPKGQSINARPVGVYGDKIQIEMQDGRKMSVSTSLFSQEDALYLDDWAISYLAGKDQLLKVEAKRKEVRTKDYKKDVPLTSGGVAEDALEVEEFDGFYEVSLTNQSELKIDLLRVEYRIFSEQEDIAQRESEDVRYTRKGGLLEYTLGPRETKMQTTESVKLVETKLGKGIVWSGGGDLKQKAKMAGVWCRVYSGDTMIQEFAQPTVLMKRANWK